MKNNILEIGDGKVYLYQRVIVVVGIIMLLLFIYGSIVFQNPYYKFFPLIILIFFMILLFLYSFVYSIYCDSRCFRIKNIFKQREIELSQFVEVTTIRHIDFLYVVVFKNSKFLVLKKSDDFFKSIFKSKKNVANELTFKIKEHINNLKHELK